PGRERGPAAAAREAFGPHGEGGHRRRLAQQAHRNIGVQLGPKPRGGGGGSGPSATGLGSIRPGGPAALTFALTFGS
ncbi:hypothetical protein, partial [Nocardia abscessus]|uniref:hypothetical protein n=1 Tax=Nocardia abscessus TaxID=120957 RepID=UPI003CC7CB85